MSPTRPPTTPPLKRFRSADAPMNAVIAVVTTGIEGAAASWRTRQRKRSPTDQFRRFRRERRFAQTYNRF